MTNTLNLVSHTGHIRLSDEIEVYFLGKSGPLADPPNAGITVRYRGVLIADFVVEFQDGELSLNLAHDESGHYDEQTFNVEQLEEIVRQWETEETASIEQLEARQNRSLDRKKTLRELGYEQEDGNGS